VKYSIAYVTCGLASRPNAARATEEVRCATSVPHGLRSTFRDWCGENGNPRDLAELSLAHVVGSKTDCAYFRNKLVEQRRAIMDPWAAYCAG
jgi:integrase